MKKLKDHEVWKQTVGIYAPKKEPYIDPMKTLTKKERSQNKRLKKTYGINIFEKRRMYRYQDGRCAICTLEFPIDSLHVDHCHLGGHVRDLLCNGCNAGIGCLKESPDIMKMAARYIHKHDIGYTTAFYADFI